MHKLTVFSSQINDVLRHCTLSSRESSRRSGGNDPGDVISISLEAKKKQIVEQAKQDVLKRIRETAREWKAGGLES